MIRSPMAANQRGQARHWTSGVPSVSGTRRHRRAPLGSPGTRSRSSTSGRSRPGSVVSALGIKNASRRSSAWSAPGLWDDEAVPPEQGPAPGSVSQALPIRYAGGAVSATSTWTELPRRSMVRARAATPSSTDSCGRVGW